MVPIDCGRMQPQSSGIIQFPFELITNPSLQKQPSIGVNSPQSWTPKISKHVLGQDFFTA